MGPIAVRLPDNMVRRIDDYVEVMKGEFPLLTVIRADNGHAQSLSDEAN
jgi:hypothetical protein